MNAKHTYLCPKTRIPPIMDGNVRDEAWLRSPLIPLVTTQTGEPVRKTTFARMCWDDEYLYVAFECLDTDIYGTLTHRDDPIHTEDVVEVFLSPNGDLTHYYEFEVSPRNVLFDAEIRTENEQGDGMVADVAWNCEGWRTAVLVDGTIDDRTDTDTGWKAELAIPFASLNRRKPRVGEKWRANMFRIDRSPEPAEYQAWSPTYTDPPNFHKPSSFGVIEFVDR